VYKNAVNLGYSLTKACGIPKGGKCGIYSVNRPEWTSSMLAMWSQGLVCVPLYDSVGVDAVRFVINHASLPLVVCERSKLATLLNAGRESKHLRHIVLIEPVTGA
jgi:long-chain acyl-CoA synthetase